MKDLQLEKDIIEAVRRLNELPGLLVRERQRLLKWAGEPMLQAAKRNAPRAEKTVKRYKAGKVVGEYRPGNLRRSIVYLPLRLVKSKVFIGPLVNRHIDAYYAQYVEFGTENQAAQPFMRPAFYENREIVLARLRRAIAGEIKPWAAKWSARVNRR